MLYITIDIVYLRRHGKFSYLIFDEGGEKTGWISTLEGEGFDGRLPKGFLEYSKYREEIIDGLLEN